LQPQRHTRIPIFLVLQDGNFRTIWYVGILVELSRRLEQLVLSWFILEATGSPFQLALVLVFLNLPRPFLAMFSGIVAERFNRHHILLLVQSINALIAMWLLVLFANSLMQPWHVFLATFLQGAARALEDPSRRTAIFDIVGRERLINAMSMETISNTVGKLIGPILGGVLLSLSGFTGAYGFVLAVHLLALGLLVPLGIPSYESASSHSSSPSLPSELRLRTETEPVWRSLGVAIRFALHSPMLLGVLYITIVMNALVFPAQQFIPAIGRDYLGVGPALVGLLAAGEGFGQLFGAGAMASMRNHQYHGRVFVVGSLIVLVTAVLFVWSPWYALSFVLLTIGGIGQAGFSAMQSSITMLWSPPEMRGRMMGVLSICIGTGTPLGTLEIGAVAAAYDTQWAISANALAGLLLILPILALTSLVWQPSGRPPHARPAGGADAK